MRARPIKLICLLALLASAADAHGDEIRIATASNFRHAADEIAQAFEQASGQRATLVFGATGKHYAQITHGAPFDIFLAADRHRPERLESEGNAVAGSRFTYAVGRLALWSPGGGITADAEILREGNFRRLAIANPELAPYGLAAKQTLQEFGLWEPLSGKLVRGENVAQAFQFTYSGNAELGLIALSQLQLSGEKHRGNWWLVPASMHRPIDQQAVLINDKPAAREFLDFMRSPAALEIIRSHGYGVPDDQ